MQVGLRRKQGGLQFTVLLDGALSYGRDEWFALNEDTDPVGLIRRFEGLIKGIPRFLAQKTEELEKARADLPRLERLIAAPAFGKQHQLDDARARMLRLEAALQPRRQDGGQTMRDDLRNQEWQRLDEETKTAVRDVIVRAHAERSHVSAPFGSGDLYAYPQGAEGICWGINGGEDGFNIARGLMSGRELEIELQSARTADDERRGAAARPVSDIEHRLREMTDPLDGRDRAIFELSRQLATGAGETPPRGEVIADALEAGLPDMHGVLLSHTSFSQKEQIMNNGRHDFTAAAARLEPHELVHVQRLVDAGTDEAAFDLAFNRLRADRSLSDLGLSKVAEAYAGGDQDRTDRQATLGAIETRFYDARKTQFPSRQNGGRSAGG
jgi:hypothetical protein